jgi:membrane associated rhomboid family serine protease
VFPIRDTIPSRSAPLVTWALIVVNAIVFLYQLALPRPALESFIYYFGMVPAAMSASGASALPASAGLVSFVSSMFIHGGLLHLVANMWTLWIFGDNVEDRMGRGRFLAFYLSCGLAAGIAHWLSNPSSTTPTVGASGAIAGVLGAYFVLFPRSRVLTLVPILFYPLFIELPAFLYLGFWFLTQLVSGGMAAGSGGIAWWAHIGGFIAGIVLFRPFLKRRALPEPSRHFVLRNPPRARWPHRGR